MTKHDQLVWQISLKPMRQLYVIALLIVGSVALDRTFTMKNLCQEPVWFGLSGGSAANRFSRTDTKCGSDGDCVEGTKCIQTGDIRQCFWVNPVPSDNNYKLDPKQTKDVKIPILDNGSDIIWSGVITGRSNCNAVSCEKADCGNGDQGCKPSQGFQQPATQAEFTLAKNNIDFYDVEVINGFHMPVSMGPSNTSGGDSYKCGHPGAKLTRTKVGSCSWQMNPPSNDYNWVSAGGVACSSGNECGSGSVCGLSFNPGHADLFKKSCGKHLGFWTADQVCGIIPNFGAPFNCGDKLPAPQDGLTNWHLHACVGMGSCYQDGAQSTCCGCVNWEEEGIDVPSFPTTEKCKNSNPAWHQRIKQTISWIKKACPTAYIYPFDDMSSTFTCANMQGGVNLVNYEVTFCPQNA